MLRLFVPGPVKPHSGQFSVSEPEPARSSAAGRGTLGARTAAMRHLRLLLRPREFCAEFLGARQPPPPLYNLISVQEPSS